MVVAVDGEGWVMVQVSHCLICSILQALLWSQGSLQSSEIFHKRTEKPSSVKPLQCCCSSNTGLVDSQLPSRHLALYACRALTGKVSPSSHAKPLGLYMSTTRTRSAR